MLSGKLIHLIELHHKELTERIIREIWRQADLAYLQRLTEAELRERCHVLLENFGFWLSHGNVDELASQQQAVGALRCQQGVPLPETMRALCVMKYNLIDFIEEQGIPKDPVSLYAEEELEHRVGRFFDILITETARGYEAAWQRAAHAVA